MRLLHTLIVMFVGSFLIQYYLMSAIMTNSLSNVRNSYGKMYISVIMGLFMVLLEVYMHDSTYNVFNYKYYLVFGLLLGLFVYFYRQQTAIKDKQYLEEMIEHHSMAILTSKKIVEKTNNYYVAKLAKDILQKQEDEINIMKNLVKNMN
jgi:hypothetical protein